VARTPKNKILVVDDDDDIRNFTSQVLELEGYEVNQANNGVSALALVNTILTLSDCS